MRLQGLLTYSEYNPWERISEVEVEISLQEQIGALLRQRGLKIAVAESCTGGLIADRLTDVPGSSAYFMGGIVAYAYEAKVQLLGVSWETLQKYGAVSRETVLEMAIGVRQALSVDLALAVSGIAGPGGGLLEKPVGTTWIGLATPSSKQAWHYLFNGDRLQNKGASAEQALRLLLQHLQETA
jgi:PncC family amidohydrolase